MPIASHEAPPVACISRRWSDALVIDPEVSETSPVVRGTWITVAQIVSLVCDGYTWSDILRACPELTENDIRTCLAFAVDGGSLT